MPQITHERNEEGRYIQIVTPEELRAVLDGQGGDYSRPSDFRDGDEWNVAGVDDRDGSLYIRSHKTGETEELHRDVCHSHPAWVHAQLGTESESDLQHMLDACEIDEYLEHAGKEDAAGIFWQAD